MGQSNLAMGQTVNHFSTSVKPSVVPLANLSATSAPAPLPVTGGFGKKGFSGFQVNSKSIGE